MSDHRPRDPAKLKRQERLEASLKENLRRRKAQARARTDRPNDDSAGTEATEGRETDRQDGLSDVDFRAFEP